MYTESKNKRSHDHRIKKNKKKHQVVKKRGNGEEGSGYRIVHSACS